MINVNVNGEEQSFDGQNSLTELLESMQIKPGTVVIEHNGEIIDRVKWNNVFLSDGDTVEIISFVGGG